MNGILGAASWKAALKNAMLKQLHAREEIVSRVATRVARDGVSRRIIWAYDAERRRVLDFLETCRRGDFEYSFCPSVKTACLYGSVYAFMLRSMFGAFESAEQSNAWIDYFDKFQSSSDGLFRDPVLAGSDFEHQGKWGEGWGVRHLVAHLIIPYAREKRSPPHVFKFVDPLLDAAAMEEWLAKFTFGERLWSQSNYIMNLYSVLQFMRDFASDERAGQATRTIANWLTANQNAKTGMWHTETLSSRADMNDAIRGAYHYYPLFEYDGLSIQYQEPAIDLILKTQNAWGTFEQEDQPAGACEDLDALDPLIRFAARTGHRKTDVALAVERAFVWLLACQNADGGYSSIPEHGCHYGGHPLTTSQPKESNLFATWFRTLAIAHVTKFLGLDQAYQIGHFPGYEIELTV